MAKKNFYDLKAFKYDRYDKSWSKYSKITSDNIFYYLLDKDYISVLDVGCGTGYLIDRLSRKKVALYYGIDTSNNMLDIAKGKNIQGSSFNNMDAIKLDYASNSFDIVIFNQSLHHIKDYNKALSESYRVLKLGGLIIVGEYYPKLKLIDKIYNKIIGNEIYKYFSKEDMTNILKSNKFNVLKTEISDNTYITIGKK